MENPPPRDTDQQFSETQTTTSQRPESSGRMSSSTGAPAELAAAPSGNAPASAAPAPAGGLYTEQVQNVVNSEIGVQVLLNRLKQSVASAKEFALFLQKRSKLEEDHSVGLRKISKITHDNLRRPEHRQNSFIASYDEVTRIQDRMAENGAQFAASLHQMHEDMLEMAANIERGRKHWKTTGLSAEQRLVDAETAMRKAKAKYDTLAEDYDRARTGDRASTKKFGLKGPKSAAQHEEDLLRKTQAADTEYASKVQTAQSVRHEHLTKGRPEAVKGLQDLINECDSALVLQMQKFAAFNEKLLLHNGMSVSPLKDQAGEGGKTTRSLREAILDINNEGDLNYFIASHSSQVPPRPAEIKYERHPVMAPSAPPAAAAARRQSEIPQGFNSFASRQGTTGPAAASTPTQQSPMGAGGPGFNQGGPPPPAAQQQQQQQPQQYQQHERSFSQGRPQSRDNGPPGRMGNGGPAPAPAYSSAGGPPQLQTLPFQTPAPQTHPLQQNTPTHQQGPPQHLQQHQQQQYGAPQQQQRGPAAMDPSNLPPLKPVFGMNLEQLFQRDGSPIPMVVYQCIQAVDLFGLEVEGIYRVSGTAAHINKIKAIFNNDSSKVDFRNPEAFFHDVNSVAGLLKQFFRDLPDPLLTTAQYASFISAARLDDDIVRRDSLHAIINALPDPNYATLRAVTLHLHRVTEAASVNRMTSSNLAIVWGPTLMGMGGVGGGAIQDAGWQVRVVQTILENCYQIFDDD
ncbi:hypothetical protein VE01_02590 [Pseudogymnoascus verrucosus]|uniref:Rho-GAP domain-containing protein n=1 Tax=Pseudogymnoascus verrucosus TaxID=342668 RepID=A0A1B8GTR3_9PEZI|nr:uncharacterized protein VE01_02590 [Pseudogymnoascus verrucosus]OBT99219.1 hypothetical protein VE01_02590 [Pseudogymnoascus verrucosus]